MFAGYSKKEFIQTMLASISMLVMAYLSTVGLFLLF